MEKPIVIYHGNCADGFSAAWAIWKKHPNWEFHPGIYQQDPPDVTGRDVYLVDFSYKRPIVEAMLETAKSITILDHHKSAVEELQPLLDDGRIGGVFDLDRSGARIAWDWFHDEKPPKLLLHVEDRDLWRFALAGTREIQAAVFSYEYDFAMWDILMWMDPDDLRNEGTAIERKHFKDIHEFLTVAKRRMTIAGHDVPVLNAPYFWASDAGHIMAKGEPFAACYWDQSDGRLFSLRSADDGEDVSAVAKQFGGGGHRSAAGFKTDIGWDGE